MYFLSYSSITAEEYESTLWKMFENAYSFTLNSYSEVTTEVLWHSFEFSLALPSFSS